MNKLLSTLIIFTFLLGFSAPFAFAQEAGTLLPQVSGDDNCETILNDIETFSVASLHDIKTKEPLSIRQWFVQKSATEQNNILACGIMTGKIQFWMVPFYIVYIIEFIIGISGLIAIIFLVYAGFQYIFAGASESQEKANTTIKNAITGLVIILVAWVVVNLVQLAVTI